MESWGSENYPPRRCYSYITPDYGITSHWDGNAVEMWMEQMRRWRVAWVSDQPISHFFWRHPHPKKAGDFMGATEYEQVLQHEGSLIAVYNIPSGSFAYIDGLVSKKAVLKKVEDSGWLFLHGGSVLIASRTIKPYAWAPDRKICDEIAAPQGIVKSVGRKNGVIVETSSPADYSSPSDAGLPPSQRLDAELARFVHAVKTKTTVDGSGIDNACPRLHFVNLAGVELDLTYEGLREINGTAVDYNAWPAHENPWMTQDFNGTTLVLEHGGDRRTYNFSNWSIADE